jgi:hypothetical protein
VMPKTPEHRRLDGDAHRRGSPKAWGPYLSERPCGTVREDYSRVVGRGGWLGGSRRVRAAAWLRSECQPAEQSEAGAGVALQTGR